jgi:hypothetical protein
MGAVRCGILIKLIQKIRRTKLNPPTNTPQLTQYRGNDDWGWCCFERQIILRPPISKLSKGAEQNRRHVKDGHVLLFGKPPSNLLARMKDRWTTNLHER